MKVQIVYTSLTGCTKKLAQAIYDGLPTDNKSIHDLKDGIPTLDGDIVLLGYWSINGGPCEEMQDFLKTVTGKAVGVFCTLGYYADSAYGYKTLETAINLLKDRNEIIGSYICNGKVAQHLIDGQSKGGNPVPTEQKELRWEMIKNHPTQAECALGAERFRERIHMYARSQELNIPFQSIL